MGNSLLNELSSLESGLERTHVNSIVNLEECDVRNGSFTRMLTSTHIKVWEPSTDHIFLLWVIVLTVVLHLCLCQLVIERWSPISRLIFN